jgi:hypothetical protein
MPADFLPLAAPESGVPGRGFAAGTLVHTDMGLVPIEQLRIGDRVVSKPESDEDAAPVYREVAGVAAFAEQEPYLVHGYRSENNVFALCAMDRQRFWVNGAGWTEAGQLDCGRELAVLEGPVAMSLAAVPIFKTLEPGIGWVDGIWGTGRSDSGAGNLVDLRDERWIGIGMKEDWNMECWGCDGRGFRFRLPVFALDIEGFHTYFVSPQGVWVHDGTNAPRPHNTLSC